MDRVLDAFALLAWLGDESGSDYVEELLRDAADGESRLHISSVNLGEVYYRLIKLEKVAEADQLLAGVQLGEVPVRRVAATNARVDAAAKLKGAHAISFADAFAVALALELRSPLVTNDPEIIAISAQGVVETFWASP